jgi:hypothetical protein
VHLRSFGRLFKFIRGIHRGPTPQFEIRAVERPRSLAQLPLLTHLEALEPTDWLVVSLTTFARNVSSFLPGQLPAYARVYHPFDGDGSGNDPRTWRELEALTGEKLRDRETAADFALSNGTNMQARVGNLPLPLIEVFVEHLGLATTTPELCYFAVWEGYGDSVAPPRLNPKLELPNRAYDVFYGPLAAARTSLSVIPFGHQSANLWWPADQAWCVATEVDFAWTYVGARRDCIAALLADPRLEAVETNALADW